MLHKLLKMGMDVTVVDAAGFQISVEPTVGGDFAIQRIWLRDPFNGHGKIGNNRWLAANPRRGKGLSSHWRPASPNYPGNWGGQRVSVTSTGTMPQQPAGQAVLDTAPPPVFIGSAQVDAGTTDVTLTELTAFFSDEYSHDNALTAVDVQPVPEPSTTVLIGLDLAMLPGMRRRGD